MFKKNKNKNKIILKIFLIFLVILFFTPILALAATGDSYKVLNPLDNLQVEIPGMADLSANNQPVCAEKNGSTVCDLPFIALYIKGFYNYSVSIVGILAAVAMIIGGILWLTSAGNSKQVKTAKELIIGSVSGLFLVLTAYIILNTVNPELIGLKSISLETVAEESLFDKEAFGSTGAYMTVGKYCGCIPWKGLTFSSSPLNTKTAVENAIKDLKPNSPLIQYSQQIVDAARKYNIDPALIISKLNVENGLATAPSGIFKKYNNLGSITCREGSSGTGWTCVNGGSHNWKKYDNYGASIDDYFNYMTTSKIMQKSTSVREMLSKYAPPCDGNDSVRYINSVMTVLAKYNNGAAADTVGGTPCTEKCWEICKPCFDAKKNCDAQTGL